LPACLVKEDETAGRSGLCQQFTVAREDVPRLLRAIRPLKEDRAALGVEF
jgi:hypothetical protein